MNGFVADEHIPLATILLLRESGFRVVSIREEHQGLGDDLILELADRENLVVITNDKDFGDLVFLDKIAFSTGIIFCRLGRFLPREIGELILYQINEYGAEFGGKMTVLSRNKFRQRDL